MKNLTRFVSKFFSLMKKFAKYLRKFGFIKGIILIIRLRILPNKGLISVSVPGLLYPVIIRKKTTDVFIFDEIFILGRYDIPYFKGFSPGFIIDGGAYVGYSSVFLANKFPEAMIVAVEPDKSNFSILEKNTSQYGNIKIVNAGIWNRNTFLKVKDVHVGNYGFIVEETDQDDAKAIKAITIGDILKEYHNNEIDILKLDTEGAEKEIFSDNYDDWLSRTKMIIIELHDFNKEGCSETFYSAINKYNFTEIMRDEENVFFLRVDS